VLKFRITGSSCVLLLLTRS